MIDKADRLGVVRVFALTLDAAFFRKLGFEVIEKELLAMRLWRDCARCPKQENCDELAVIKTVLRGALRQAQGKL